MGSTSILSYFFITIWPWMRKNLDEGQSWGGCDKYQGEVHNGCIFWMHQESNKTHRVFGPGWIFQLKACISKRPDAWGPLWFVLSRRVLNESRLGFEVLPGQEFSLPPACNNRGLRIFHRDLFYKGSSDSGLLNVPEFFQVCFFYSSWWLPYKSVCYLGRVRLNFGKYY